MIRLSTISYENYEIMNITYCPYRSTPSQYYYPSHISFPPGVIPLAVLSTPGVFSKHLYFSRTSFSKWYVFLEDLYVVTYPLPLCKGKANSANSFILSHLTIFIRSNLLTFNYLAYHYICFVYCGYIYFTFIYTFYEYTFWKIPQFEWLNMVTIRHLICSFLLKFYLVLLVSMVKIKFFLMLLKSLIFNQLDQF